MGCDIHSYAEVRNERGVWKKVGPVFNSSYYDPQRPTQTLSDGYVLNASMTDTPYQSRNYTLFAILADVRNGNRFASMKRCKEVFPLFKARGIPTDASKGYKAIVSDWGVDGHSHSYATLAELQVVDWDDIYVSEEGFLPLSEYERIRNTEEYPQIWCRRTSAQVMTIEAYENNYRNKLEASGQIEEMSKGDGYFSSIYIKYSWVEPVMLSVGPFVEETIPALSKLGKPEDVRLVFFFDN